MGKELADARRLGDMTGEPPEDGSEALDIPPGGASSRA
jgi:hypothetical protein